MTSAGKAPLESLSRTWSFPALRGLRGESGPTYLRFDLDAQPPVSADHDLRWLDDESIKAEWSIEKTDGGQTRALDPAGLDAVVGSDVWLPDSLRTLAKRPDIQRRIRSATGCYLDLGDFAMRTSQEDALLVHVLSDQQWCLHWLLYVDSAHREAVVTTPEPLGFDLSGQEEEPPPAVIPVDGSFNLEVCADSFTEFIYRFWVENELFYALVKGERLEGPLSEYAAQLRSGFRPDQ